MNHPHDEQENLNAEMLAAISKLTRAGFLLLIVLVVLFWQNHSRFFSPAKDYVVQAEPGSITVFSPVALKGKDLFKNNCASCHNRNMHADLTGPALGGVRERWAAYPQTDLYQWVRNSQSLVSAGHPRAQELWKKWSPTIMTSFNSLQDADIEAILTYVDEQYAAR